MSDSRTDLERRIREEWGELPEQIAFRYLTKALSAAKDLTPSDHEDLRNLLDAEILRAAERPKSAAAPSPTPAPSPQPKAPFDPSRIALIAADALQAPTDGSEERFKVLADRARSTLEHEMKAHDTAWLQRLGHRRALERELESHRATMVRGAS